MSVLAGRMGIDHALRPSLPGSVVLHFVIGGNGKVKSVKTSGGTMRDADVSRCMEYNTSLLQFPPHGGGAVVTYPFVFSSGS